MKKLREQSAESKKAARDIRVSDPNPFPNMSKWWTEPKEKLMSFVYYMKGQIPPHNKADYKKNWKKVVEGLQKQYPAPTEAIYKKKLNETVLSGKSLLTENVRQKNSFPKFTKKELKEIRREAAIKARVDEFVKHKAYLLENEIANTPANKLKLHESSYSELQYGVKKVLNENNQHIGDETKLIYEGKVYNSINDVPRRVMLEAYINNRCNKLMEGEELQEWGWLKRAAKKVGGAIKKGYNKAKDVVKKGASYVKKNVIDPTVAGAKKAGKWVKDNAGKIANTAADIGQGALTIGGMIPIVGNVFDAANTAWSAGRAAIASSPEARKKHLKNMAVNAAAMIPGAGLAVGAGKIGAGIVKGGMAAAKAFSPTVAKLAAKGSNVASKVGSSKIAQGASNLATGAANKFVKGTDAIGAAAVSKFPGLTKLMTGPKAASQYSSKFATGQHVIPSRASMVTGVMKQGADLTPRMAGKAIGKGIRTKLDKKLWTKGAKYAGLPGGGDLAYAIGSGAVDAAKGGANWIGDQLANMRNAQNQGGAGSEPIINPYWGPKY